MRIISGLGTRFNARGGMTLLEVVLALAIFISSLAAVSQLITFGTNQAVDIQFNSRATRLAQSKMAEYTAGVWSLQGGGGSGSFQEEEEPDWNWSADIQAQGSAQNLYLVTITVKRDVPGRGHFETKLTQYIVDPKMRGAVPIPSSIPPLTATLQPTGSSAAGASASSGGGGGGGSTSTSGGSSGGSKGGGAMGGTSGSTGSRGGAAPAGGAAGGSRGGGSAPAGGSTGGGKGGG